MSEPAPPEQHWRWPNTIAMSPSSLKAFGECPSRIKMRYLQNLDPPERWIRVFGLGNATHSALGTIAQQMKVGAELIGDEQVRNLARLHLPEREYPTPESREADILQVLEWVRRGTAWLKTLDVQEWLLIEQKQRRAVPLFPARTTYELLTKPDLIVKRLDADGNPFIQIIDWKTGQEREEPDVPVIMRYAIRENLQRWTGDATAATVEFTWFWLDLGYRTPFDCSTERCTDAWPGILKQMEDLATETEWRATPGWHCRFCPYYQNHCPEEIPPDTGW